MQKSYRQTSRRAEVKKWPCLLQPGDGRSPGPTCTRPPPSFQIPAVNPLASPFPRGKLNHRKDKYTHTHTICYLQRKQQTDRQKGGQNTQPERPPAPAPALLSGGLLSEKRAETHSYGQVDGLGTVFIIHQT